ncbi:VWA domain-containing protein [Aquimarina megaterium]|uniref:VWA domain-containing protein n=1 Tax=Aquimarina megaterium TaxID=1443666 RepID=UPI0004700BD6|nr:VWA domain-containing protein [Aquimarina megaterium]
MSHNIGTLVEIASIGIGPDHANSSFNFSHTPAPGQPTRFVILHFKNAFFPPGNRLEVNLGYDTDVFNESNGSEFWTRPINVNALPEGNIPINYIEDGSSSGGVELGGYGRGHRTGGNELCTFTNADIFLHTDPYDKPVYDTYWICGGNASTCISDPKWKNFNALPAGLRKTIGQAACMIVSAHGDHLSTCSATLVAEDLVFSAGHCFSVLNAPSPLDPFSVLTASIVFNYQTNADGLKPEEYSPKIFKVVEVVEYGYDGGNDFVLLRIDISKGNTGITPLSMRTDLPSFGEEVFVVHHPNGAVKKFSPRDADFLTISGVTSSSISVDLDVAGGSSGSGLYDKFGNVIGTLSSGQRRDSEGSCSNYLGYFPTATMLNLIGTTPPPPAVDRDVMIVLDRSGSMSQNASTGQPKIEEARDAVSLFVSMIEQEEGHRVGLVSFNNISSRDHELKPNTDLNVETLIGPAPHSMGIVGRLIPSGSTTIGGGLDLALSQFSGSDTKDEVILLLTDGMENTPPMIEDIESRIGDRRLCIVGYGDESNLNGPLLARLAILNDGSYTVAQDELSLKKFFASCFGDIFEAGFLMDPDFEMPRTVEKAEPLLFTVCGEEAVTVVLGWDKAESLLVFNMETPSGAIVPFENPNVTRGRGRTWAFVKIKLPINAEQDGVWKVNVFRPSGGDIPLPVIDLKYFVNIVAKGGPSLKLMADRKRYYTGNDYNPLVRLFYPNNISPAHTKVKLEVKRPKQSLGNILKENGLKQNIQVSGDTVPPVYSTLAAIKNQNNGQLVDYETLNFELFDDGRHDDGAMEPDGIFGSPLKDLFNAEGLYSFRAIATFGHNCEATRELVWSIYTDSKVDENNTNIDSINRGDDGNGKQDWIVTIIPKDPYNNFLGPGRLDVLGVKGTFGTYVTSGVKDNGDGTYSVNVKVDPTKTEEPSILIQQPGSDPVVFCKPKKAVEQVKSRYLIWLWLLILILIIIIIVLII